MKYIMPKINYIGIDCLKDGIENISELGYQRILIITDQFLFNKTQIIKQLAKDLEAKKIKAEFYADVQANPTVNNVNTALKIFCDQHCEAIIAVGGGSSQDAAKLVALLATNNGIVQDYHGVDLSKHVCAPLICINTTAGTASEVTKNAVITDETKHIKMVIVDKNITPWISINDPRLMTTMPALLTGYTGMDALTHAIECLITKGADLLTDMCASQAINLICSNLINTAEHGENIELREKMAYAEFIAGMGFNSAGLGIVHSLSHQLTSQYGIPHGLANALLLPYVLRWNLKYDNKKLNQLMLAMGLTPTDSKENNIDKVFKKIKEMNSQLHFSKLAKLNVNPKDFKLLASQAINDVCTFGNPRPVNEKQMIALYQEAFDDKN